jgi:hypothetical protein
VEIQTPSGQIIRPVKWRKNKNGKEPYQGGFRPGNVKKYTGDVNKIVFRSGMELRLFKYLDANPRIASWSSEETVIPYMSPMDNKVHRYFVDVKASVMMKDGTTKTYLIEVKESSQTRPPKLPKTGKKTPRFLREQKTYAVNYAKWETAKKLCQKMGWDFIIMTDKQLRF